MFDYFYKTDEEDTRYKFFKDGVVVGDFKAEVRAPSAQAIAVRDEKYPGAEIFVNVLERSEEKEVAENVAV